MQRYEIRVLGIDGRTALITAETHWNDAAAICSAKRLAQGRKVEVWRGMDCIFGLDPCQVLTHPPNRTAA